MTTRIRPAVAEDAPDILGLVQRFLASTRYGEVLPYSPEALGALLALCVEQEAGFVHLGQTETKPGVWKSVAIIGAISGAHPITGQGTIEELIWWVDPEARTTRLGYRLLGSLEDWGRHKGHSMLKMVAPVEPDGTCPVGAFYQRLGYVPLEVVHFKRL